ncbi:hypothetical protein CBS147320_7416 [Aspergillus niger]|nr:hypothetical protein CBS133816_8470 [Aspergillus niger]KAI2851649.1 hypothetical protein CBS12448_8439 [Aspergillus niger]KAI2922421.1 hypothetical protein CBS147320_7416 [Aspergillus niger]KAI2943200.1 hypothetical protein CBS147322_8558 [Aspergillus niger]
MPEAPNNRSALGATRGTPFSPPTPPAVRAPPLTDYDDLDAGHHGHTPTYSTTSTVFNNSPARNSHGVVQIHTAPISWPSDGPAMYLAPPMPATTPGTLQTTTDDHGITDIQHFPAHFIPSSYIESFENMPDAIARMGSLNSDSSSGSIAWMQEGIAEPSAQSVGIAPTAGTICPIID